MKKFVFAILIFFFVANEGFAGELGFGVNAGLNVANQGINNSPGNNFSSLIGFTGGLFTDIKLFDFLSLQSEADFTMKGIQDAVPSYPDYDTMGNLLGFPRSDFSFKYEYLEVPLLLKGNFNLTPQLQINLLSGPSVAFLLNETTTLSQPSFDNSLASSASVDDTKDHSGIDWGVILGAGIEYQKLLFEIRYDLGLDSVNKPTLGIVKNSVLSFVVGYRIF